MAESAEPHSLRWEVKEKNGDITEGSVTYSLTNPTVRKPGGTNTHHSTVSVRWIYGSDCEDTWESVQVYLDLASHDLLPANVLLFKNGKKTRNAWFGASWDNGRDSCSKGYGVSVDSLRGEDMHRGYRTGSGAGGEPAVTAELARLFRETVTIAGFDTLASFIAFITAGAPARRCSGCNVQAYLTEIWKK